MARVLVVDDDLGIRETVGFVLRAKGHEVLTARSGRESLHLIELEPPDAMLLDLRLPDMTGLELIERIRDLGNAFPIVIITGFGTIRSAVAAISRGALDYLEKPLDIGEITAAVERALRGASGNPRSLFRVDGVARWATAIASVLNSPRDPRTIDEWAGIRGVAAETLRSWCRTADLSPKRSLDLARVLRAVLQGNARRIPPERLLDAADHRTVERLLRDSGLTRSVPPPSLETVLADQTFVRDPIAIDELARLLREFTLNR